MTMDKVDAAVVVPTYNEADNMPVIVPQICETLGAAGISHEIIVVDDNSPDGTARIVERLAQDYPIRLRVRTKERGLATAVIAGFTMSASTVCVVMDADGSHPIEQLPAMISPILKDMADVTVGSRHTDGGAIGEWPWHRQFISKSAAMMAAGLTNMTDPTSGFLAIRRTLLEGLDLNPIGWKIVLEIVVKAAPKRLLEVPITFNDRVHGESKMSLKEQRNYLRHLARLYRFRFPTFFELMMFCFVGFSGVFVDMLSVIAVKELTEWDTRVCAVFGFSAAVTSNYVFNRYWTFAQSKKRSFVTAYFIFVSVCLVGFAARLVTMHVLIEYANMDQGNWYMLTNLLGILTATIVNFLGSKFLAFTPGRLALVMSRADET